MTDVIRVALRRRRVTELIEATRSNGALSLLVAPPGYGKTIALRDALGDDPHLRWIELPPRARLEDVVRLLTQSAVPDHLPSVAALFTGSGQPKDFAGTVEWMARRLRLFSGTIVIDDLHRARGDAPAVTFLTQIMELTASYVRWIVASREVPAFPVGTWVARGLMALPITDDDLAFDHDEAAALARTLGVTIDPGVLRMVVDDAAGWPMAVHLALQLWDRTRSIAPLRIRTRDVLFSQIETELWPLVDNDVREAIFACALLPQTHSTILEAAGFAQAEALLERAHNLVPFVQRTVDGGFALHDLFAEFIQKTIRRQPAEAAALRERLASALIATGRHADALKVLVAAGDAARVLAVVATAGFRLIDSGQRAVVDEALSFLADAGHRGAPVVAALHGALSFADGSAANAEALYRYAYEHGLPAAMRIETGRRLAMVYINRGDGATAIAVLEPLLGDSAGAANDRTELAAAFACALAAAGRAAQARAVTDDVLPELDRVTPESRARTLFRLAYTAFGIGDLERAHALGLDAAQLATNLKMWSFAALAHTVLYSVTSLTESDSSIALGHARLTYAAGERAGDSGLAAFGLRAEYVLHAYRGDEAAFDAVERQLGQFNDVRTFRASFPARNARALAHAIRGDARKAISTLAVIDAAELSGAESALRESMLALYLFLADRRQESLALLKSPLLLEASGDFASRRYLNLARVARGMALWCHDRTAQARRAFCFDETAVAENDRVLLDSIAALCATPRHLVPSATAKRILSRLASYGWGGYGRLIEIILGRVTPATALTPAEIKTLRAFQYGANTLQVAGDLGKSPHTIEAQLRSAYKKIGCVSRAEALVYARARGWLDDQRADIPESC